MALRISPQKLISVLAFLHVYTVSTVINLSSSLKYLCFVYMSGRQSACRSNGQCELSMQ